MTALDALASTIDVALPAVLNITHFTVPSNMSQESVDIGPLGSGGNGDSFRVIAEPTPPAETTHARWPPRTGYFQILSADRVRFHVAPYHLQSWS